MKRIEGLNDEDTKALEMLRALGNPARLRIVRELAGRSTCATGEIVDVLPLAQSTVSEHLKVLKESGLVRGTIDGDLCLCLDSEQLTWLAAFCDRLAACCPAEPEPVGATAGSAGR